MRHSVRKYFFIGKVVVHICVFAAVFFIAAGILTALKGVSAATANAGNFSMAAANVWHVSSAPMVKKNESEAAYGLSSGGASKADISKTESHAASSAVPSQSDNTNAVSENWFKDSVFVGNSRTEGLRNYDGLNGASYYAEKGLMVDTVYTKKAVNIKGRKLTAMQAIKEGHFGKVYLMFGINELGWSSTQTFFDDYRKIIADIKKDSPKAIIYIQSIMPVSEKKSESSAVYNNTKIKEFDERLKGLAKEEKAVYLDIAGAVSDSGGVLPDGASVDGVHLNSQYCGKWCDYLKTHT